MVFCAKCGKKLNEGARFCPRCGTPVGAQGGAGTSVSQSGGGSSGTFSWDQSGQMRDLSREFQESDVEQSRLSADSDAVLYGSGKCRYRESKRTSAYWTFSDSALIEKTFFLQELL